MTMRPYSCRVFFSLCVISNESDGLDGLVEFRAVMPVMKGVAESLDALLGRKLRWRRCSGWRSVDSTRATQINRFQLAVKEMMKMRKVTYPSKSGISVT